MKIKNQWPHLITIVLIAAALLVGNRFDARWAGGDGYQEHQIAIGPHIIRERGEVISSDEATYFTFGDAVIHIDENTEVKLIDGREGHETIQLIQGRVLVGGDIDITVREVTISSTEATSVVHYSWLDEIDVIFFDDTSSITTPELTLSATDLDATMIKMNTLTYDYTEHEFNLENSSAKNFYETVLD
jgi:hypothetical protein